MAWYSIHHPGHCLTLEQSLKRAKWLQKHKKGVVYNCMTIIMGTEFPAGSPITKIDMNTGNCTVSCRCCKKAYGVFSAKDLTRVL